MASDSEEQIVGQHKAERTPRVLGVSLPAPLADRLRAICGRHGWAWSELSQVTSFSDIARQKADVLVIPDGEREQLRRLLSEESANTVPALLIGTEAKPGGHGAPKVGDKQVVVSADDDSIGAALERMLRRRESVELVMRQIDPQSRELAADPDAVWIRSRLGIIGVVHVPTTGSAGELREEIGLSVRKAYALLDRLPEDELSLEDLWNLLLFVSVPWSQEEADGETEIASLLEEMIQDTSGSRKVILWKGQSLIDHLGPMGQRGTLWLPSSPDPLRHALQTAVRDKRELDALEALFKARISEGDLDEIVRVLGLIVE